MVNKEKVFDFLYKLQKSGQTNMWGAAPFMERDFPVSIAEARALLSEWQNAWNQEGYDRANRE